MPDTMQQLRRALSRLDEMNHQISALEERERRERQEARERADHARYLTSREHLLDVQAAKREYQQRCDDALQPWGERAPMSRADESINRYRRRLADTMQRRLPEDDELRGLDLARMPQDAYDNFEAQLYPKVAVAADRPDSTAAGELREVTRVDPRKWLQGELVRWPRELRQANGSPRSPRCQLPDRSRLCRCFGTCPEMTSLASNNLAREALAQGVSG
jgi:hypothetical protein